MHALPDLSDITNIGQDVLKDMRYDIFEHLQRLPFSYFDTRPHGKIFDPCGQLYQYTERSIKQWTDQSDLRCFQCSDHTDFHVSHRRQTDIVFIGTLTDLVRDGHGD